MAQFSQRFIRSIIWTVWDQAQDGASSFYDAINALKSAQWQNVGTGWVVQTSSGAGYATSFHLPAGPTDLNQMTPAALQELCQQILEYYAKVNLPEDNNIAAKSPFVAALCCFFPTIKGWLDNFMYANP